MSEVKGANVTKYDAGGSGDNYIADGYIKSVEKIWYDSYAIGTTALTTADTIIIARIPPNKKIMDVQVCYPALTTEGTGTGSTLAVGVTGDLDKFIDDVEIGAAVGTIDAKNTTSARMDNADGMAYLTTGSTNTAIILSFGRKATLTTSSTIKTIVRYT